MEAMKTAKSKKTRRTKYHVYTAAALAMIKVEVDQGLGYRAVYKKYVAMRTFGKKNWSEMPLKDAIFKLKKPI